MAALRGFERLHEGRKFRIHPELGVKTLEQLDSGRQAPRELRKHFVLLVGSRESRIGPGLTVVVPQVLVTPEKPQPIATPRTAQVGADVTILHTLVPALQLTGTWEH